MNEVPQFWEGMLHFPPDDSIYKEHFRGCPVVPGSLIVEACLKAAETSGLAAKISRIDDFTFRTFLTPGTYPCCLERETDHILCLIQRNGQKLVTGRLIP